MQHGLKQVKEIPAMPRICGTSASNAGSALSLATGQYHPAYIAYQRLKRYIRAAIQLHLVTAAGLACFLTFGSMVNPFERSEEYTATDLVFLFLSFYGLVLVFFSQMDARSRLQNYKLAKDLLYENGFQERIVRLFCTSRCQRDALREAARDLGMAGHIASCLKQRGYRWYHLLPDIVFRRPELLVTRHFWRKTLFVKSYDSKYFLW